ncbi:MAG: YfhO family protein [Ruminococcus sp.]|nr:YfhO family protein [Ruminococcus sp.]
MTSFSDRKIIGRVNARKDGAMLFSMPYEKGWSVYVDGQKVKTAKVMGALLGAQVPAGEHEIKLVYTPEGFTVGVTATFVSLALCILISFFDKKRRNRLAESASDEAEDSKSEETSAENAESEEIPAENAESEETPAENAESEETPVENAESEETPAENAESEETPVENAESEGTPEEEDNDKSAVCGDENEKS